MADRGTGVKWQTFRPLFHVARNSAWLVSAEGVSRLSGFAMSLVLARSLGPSAFGVYAVAQAFMSYATISGDFGYQIIGARLAARHPGLAPYLMRVVEKKRSLVFVPSAAVLAVLALPTAATLREYAILLIGITAGLPTVIACDWLFVGLERFRLVALWRSAQSLLALAAVFLAVSLGGAMVVTVIVAQALVMMVFALWLRSCNRGHGDDDAGGRSDIDNECRLANMAALGFGMLLLMVLNGFEIFVIKAFLGDTAAGYYSAAMRLIVTMFASFAVAMMAVMPVIARSTNDYLSLRRISRFVPLALLIGGLLAVGAAAYADKIILLLYGARFETSGPLLRLMCVLLPIDLVSTLLGASTTATGSTKIALRLTIFPVAFSILAQPLLVLHLGLAGAVWGRIAAHGIQVTMIGLAYWNRSIYRWLGGSLR